MLQQLLPWARSWLAQLVQNLLVSQLELRIQQGGQRRKVSLLGGGKPGGAKKGAKMGATICIFAGRGETRGSKEGSKEQTRVSIFGAYLCYPLSSLNRSSLLKYYA